MMINENEKISLRRKLGENKGRDVIDKLLEKLDHSTVQDSSPHRNLYKDLILLKGRYSGAEHRLSIGIISLGDFSIIELSINKAILDIIDKVALLPLFEKSELTSLKDARIRREVQKKPKNIHYEYDFFLCHSTNDQIYIENIVERLRGLGFNVFMSKEALKYHSGKSFFEKIADALEKSKNFLLFATFESLSSEWVKLEYETFYNEFFLKNYSNRGFYILKDSSVSHKDFPLFLRRIQISEKLDDLIDSVINNDQVSEEVVISKSRDSFQKFAVGSSKLFKGITVILLGFFVFFLGANISQKYVSYTAQGPYDSSSCTKQFNQKLFQHEFNLALVSNSLKIIDTIRRDFTISDSALVNRKIKGSDYFNEFTFDSYITSKNSQNPDYQISVKVDRVDFGDILSFGYVFEGNFAPIPPALPAGQCSNLLNLTAKSAKQKRSFFVPFIFPGERALSDSPSTNSF